MAHLLSTQNIGITLGARHIFADVSLSVHSGNRIGIVGPNGGGKTTLMKCITGELEPTEGKVTAANTVKFARLSQEDALPEGTVRNAIHEGKATHTWASDAHIRELHQGLLPDISLDAQVTELSGGQRRRVALARTLAQEANVVILDEPTNHLDVEGITYLAKYLDQRFGGPRPEGALITITHDRWFLDAVATNLWEVVPMVESHNHQIPGFVETYEGGYSDYIFQRTERERQAAVAEEKRQNLLRKELAWLRRGAPARTSKPRFRTEAAEALIANVPPPRNSVELASIAARRLGKEVVNLEQVDYTYPGVQQPTLKNITWRMAPGERVGILGANGAGKSTLMKLIAKEIQPTEGTVKHGQTVHLATLTQHTDELNALGDMRVVEAVQDVARYVNVGGQDISAMQLTERMGFTKERAWTRLSELSGGERRRVQFMRILMDQPNVLLLDEPTNDLDTDTLASIEDVLDSWAGTLVVVSHDRYLLERIADKQMAVLNHTLRDLPGGVEEYLRLREQELASKQEATQSSVKDSDNDVVANTQANREALKEARKEVRRIEKSMERTRRELEKVRTRSAEIAQTIAETEKYEELANLGTQEAQLASKLEQLEEEWLIAAEQAEG